MAWETEKVKRRVGLWAAGKLLREEHLPRQEQRMRTAELPETQEVATE